MATETGSGLPLESYTKTTSPGWKVGTPKYTFRRFLERLRLWYRQTDLPPESLGPAVAGRLQGRLFDTALGLKFTLANGTRLVGDEALAYPGADAVFDLNTGAVVTPAEDNGLQRLLRILTQQHGADDQQQITGIIDQYDDLRQGRMSLLDYLNEEATLFEDASRLANYGINDVARSHKLLKHSSLSDERKDDLLLKLNFDLARYDELRRLLEKLAKSKQPNQLPVPHGIGGSNAHFALILMLGITQIMRIPGTLKINKAIFTSPMTSARATTTKMMSTIPSIGQLLTSPMTTTTTTMSTMAATKTTTSNRPLLNLQLRRRLLRQLRTPLCLTSHGLPLITQMADGTGPRAMTAQLGTAMAVPKICPLCLLTGAVKARAKDARVWARAKAKALAASKEKVLAKIKVSAVSKAKALAAPRVSTARAKVLTKALVAKASTRAAVRSVVLQTTIPPDVLGPVEKEKAHPKELT